MAYSSSIQRQLAPTVAQEAPGAWIRAGSAFAGIGDTLAVGRVLYAENFPIVPNNECWIPARENVTQFDIVPVGGIHIFIGKIDDHPVEMTTSPARTAFELDTIAENQSESKLPEEISALDLENSRPTQTALGQDIPMEDQCQSTWVS